ncbi:solute carrier organic anion transporter family member 4C1-like isoform X1 [Sarcophilus harrisii]|uniref:Solute carrier organic anion transporter family member n=2 Tax=Sarcophilus harrisii TaxID=9305 RepID=G3VET7_SARHA|nr:solute carrier organic anion transporter family member 4C1-like isoform X1 [Sarcophilus harrisii]
MEETKGIDNPAFIPSSPNLQHHSPDPPAEGEASKLLSPPIPSEEEGASAPPPPRQQEQTQSPELEEGLCGWGNFTPSYLQRWNNPKGFLFHYCLLALTQGIVVNGLVNISISTIEKRYQLSSFMTGLVSSSYDISFCLLSLFISFYGERGHKPRWLAFASFMMGLGSLVFTLPHFISGKYELASEYKDTCPQTRIPNFCQRNITSSLSIYLYVFILGQMMLGVGGTPLYTLGTAFIDDSVPTHLSSLYIGIGYAMSVLGPAIGYVLGGQLLTIYIDSDMNGNIDITEDDPRWLGAWWMGFLISCFLGWSLIIPFSCFPKHLPGTALVRAGKVSQAHQDENISRFQDEEFGKTFKDFPASLLILLKNPAFMCLVLSTTTEALITTGFATFLPKYIENQFGKSSSYAATLGGIVLIPGAALGQILGGVIVSRFRMSCKEAMKFAALSSAASFLLTMTLIFMKCPNEAFAGVFQPYKGAESIGNITASCNLRCYCSRSYYYPVCGRDSLQYFSPCIAGCTSSNTIDHQKVYYNCSCVGQKKRVLSTVEGDVIDAQAGKCESRCKNLPIFFAFFFATVMFTFMAGTPVTVAILRCVFDRQHSLALGVQFMLIRLLGTIPGPMIFGIAIDSSCVLWDLNDCGVRGACRIYDNFKMAYMLVGISIICKIITISFNVFALLLYKPPSPDKSESNQGGDQGINLESMSLKKIPEENISKTFQN